MAKVISFPTRQPPAKSAARPAAAPRTGTEAGAPEDSCGCGHKDNVHIRHPNGVVSCVARGCRCETRLED